MELFGYSVLQAAFQLPLLVVLVTGLVLAVTRRHRLPRRARQLLLSGVAVLLVVELLSLAWALVLPQLVRNDWIGDGGFARFSTLSLAVGGLLSVGYPVGIGLLVGAVLAGRAIDPPGDPWSGWTPPADGGEPTGVAPADQPAADTTPGSTGWVSPTGAGSERTPTPWPGGPVPPQTGRPD